MRMDRSVVTGDIVDTWIRLGEGVRPLLSASTAATRSTSRAVRGSGRRREYMDGATSREDREAIFDRFRSGETRIICNVGVLTTGIDLGRALHHSRAPDQKPNFSFR